MYHRAVHYAILALLLASLAGCGLRPTTTLQWQPLRRSHVLGRNKAPSKSTRNPRNLLADRDSQSEPQALTLASWISRPSPAGSVMPSRSRVQAAKGIITRGVQGSQPHSLLGHQQQHAQTDNARQPPNTLGVTPQLAHATEGPDQARSELDWIVLCIIVGFIVWLVTGRGGKTDNHGSAPPAPPPMPLEVRRVVPPPPTPLEVRRPQVSPRLYVRPELTGRVTVLPSLEEMPTRGRRRSVSSGPVSPMSFSPTEGNAEPPDETDAGPRGLPGPPGLSSLFGDDPPPS